MKDLKQQYQANFIDLMETRSSGEKAEHFMKKAGFDGNFVVEVQGFSGGICCFWEANGRKVTPVCHNK